MRHSALRLFLCVGVCCALLDAAHDRGILSLAEVIAASLGLFWLSGGWPV